MNGTAAHKRLETYMRNSNYYRSSGWQAEKRLVSVAREMISSRNQSSTGLLGALQLGAKLSGLDRPDATRNDAGRIYIFDWKPITHRNSAAARVADAAQIARYVAKGKEYGIQVIPQDTRQVVKKEMAGTILGSEIIAGRRVVYEVWTYPSDQPGVAYYELKNSGQTEETWASAVDRALKSVADGTRNGVGGVLPGPLPGRFPLP